MIRVGKNTVVVHDGYTVVTLPDGNEVHSLHKEQPGQDKTAAHIGCSVETMNQTHDLFHVILADAIGLDHSPTLMDVAIGTPENEIHWIEEEAVIAMQRFAQAVGKLRRSPILHLPLDQEEDSLVS